MDWRPLLDFPWDYPEYITVAVVDDATGEVQAYVAKCADHGRFYATQYGPQDKRCGLPIDIEGDDGWRVYAWTDAPPLPPPSASDAPKQEA